MRLENIATPALIAEEEIFDRNREAMKALLAGKSLRLRPHYKSHKCADIARMQIEDGAVGITCAKLSEAEDLADAGIEDILIANQITDPAKLSRLAHLARACRVTVCVDNGENVAALARAAQAAGCEIGCLVEYEIGMGRCGVTTHEAVLDLARLIAAEKGLSFRGVQAYAGHMSHEVKEDVRRAATERNEAELSALLAMLDAAGLPAEILSGGSTGTARIKAESGVYTELQAGSYLFMDATYRELDIPFESSLFVLATVVSVRDGLVVVDAGVKSCGVDQGMPVPVGFTCSAVTASEEHFQIRNPSVSLKIGDRVRLVPGHCCSTVNLHDKLYFVKDGKVTRRVPVTARGCSK